MAYELPTSERPTNGSAYSSSLGLLPTPTTQDGANTAGPAQMRRNSLPLNAAVTALDQERQRGDATRRPSPDGKPSWDAPLLFQ
jgi:hypothetical protein